MINYFDFVMQRIVSIKRGRFFKHLAIYVDCVNRDLKEILV